MNNSFFSIKTSFLVIFFNKLYGNIQNCFHQSIIYHLLFEGKKRSALTESYIYKVFYAPFKLLNNLSEKANSNVLRQSIFLKIICNYLEYILRLNTRFFGAFLVVIGLLYAVLVRGITLYSIAAILIGIVGVLLHTEGRELLRNSLLVKAFLVLVDLTIPTNDRKLSKKNGMFYGIGTGVVVGGLMLVVGPLKATALLVAVTACFFIFYKARYGLYMVVLAAPFIDTKFVIILCVLVAGSVLSHQFFYKEFQWKLDGVGFLLLALLGMYGVGVIVSFTPMSSLPIWIVYTIFIGFYIIMYQLLTSKEMIVRVIKLFVLAGTIVGFYGILQYVFGWGVNENWIDPNVFATLTKRAYSTLENPNILGEYLILTIMAGVGIMVTRKNLWSKLAYGVCVVIMLVCLGATFSRGGWIGLFIAVALFVTFFNGKLWVLAIPIILIAPLVLPDNVIIRLTSIGNMADTSTAIRVKIWLSSLGMGSSFMMTGLGLGVAAYAYVYPFYAYYYIPALHSHNVFFQVLIEAGIVGLFLFLVVMLKGMKQMCLSFKANEKKDKTIAYLLLPIAAGMVGFLIQGLFDYSFYNYRMVLIFWMFVCFGTALSKVGSVND